MVSFAFKNYYERLGVTHQASDVEIRKAFRQLAQMYHPDIAISQRDAQEIFVLINEAHQTLINPSSRKEYDQRIVSRWNTSTSGAAPPRVGLHHMIIYPARVMSNGSVAMMMILAVGRWHLNGRPYRTVRMVL